MRFGRRKITYYDTEAGFEAEKFAARLLLLLMNEMRASGRRQVVFLCIGTDRSTGDSLGPLIGSRLEAEGIGDAVVIPGLGVRKELAAVGDISITGIVGGAESGDPLFLQSIRLSMVMRLADCISRSICLGMRIIGRRVENFSSQAAPF